GHYDQAAAAFRAALDYWTQSGAQSPLLVPLVGQTVEALLKARDYAKACAFAAEQIKTSPGRTQFVGPPIREYVDRLVTDGKIARDPQKLKDALQLIDLAKAIDPPLEKTVLADLDQLKLDADRAIKSLPATRP
ncbi:MAG TPA: hypothetical protein VGV35_13940, partial [Bryobacteraceae bacterium]|nr:hypothetical protein [Bryobacteraceae bacterium]